MNSSASQGFIQTYLDAPSQPSVSLPSLACDSHVHVFGPVERFPYGPHHGAAPASAPKEKLFALHRKMGIQRCVIVQSVTHGYDNRVVEDAIEAGGGNYLGIARVPLEVPDDELERLAKRGFRGVRFNFMRHLSGGAVVQDVVAMTPRLAAVGMHLQVHFESELVHTVGEALRASQVPVVIDHMGRVDATRGTQHPDFRGHALEMPQVFGCCFLSSATGLFSLSSVWPDWGSQGGLDAREGTSVGLLGGSGARRTKGAPRGGGVRGDVLKVPNTT